MGNEVLEVPGVHLGYPEVVVWVLMLGVKSEERLRRRCLYSSSASSDFAINPVAAFGHVPKQVAFWALLQDALNHPMLP
eukprot:442368-Lingulodinium_polyedra.AAC.1